jgi:uncharacterized membrane protein
MRKQTAHRLGKEKDTMKNVVLISMMLAALGFGLVGCGGGGSGSSAPTASGTTLSPIDDGDPGTAPGVFALATAISEANQVVGAAESTAGGVLNPAYWEVNPDATAIVAPTMLAPLVPGGFANALDINSGVIVGMAANVGGGIRAVVWANRDAAPVQLQSLTPGGSASAFGINGSGLIVGEAENGASVHKAVIWQRANDGTLTGPFTLPGVPTDWESSAYDVNEDGVIAGEIIDVSGISQAVLWEPAGASFTRRDLGVQSGFDHSVALGLNTPAPGQPLLVAGEVSVNAINGAVSAVRWAVDSSVTLTQLGAPSRDSSATAVNAEGRFAGWEDSASNVMQASTWTISPAAKSVLVTTDSQAYDINGVNIVVGRRGLLGFVLRAN